MIEEEDFVNFRTVEQEDNMQSVLIWSALICNLILTSARQSNSNILVDPADGTELASDTGIRAMLSGITYSTDYFELAQHVNTQINQAFCGVATTAAVLNSFNGDPSILQAPRSQASTPTSIYYYFDQSNSFASSQLAEGINVQDLED